MAQAPLLGNVTVAQTINCAGGGQAVLAGTWIDKTNSTTTVAGNFYRVWQVNVTHTLTGCVRRGFTIDGSFTQSMDLTGGSSYLYRQRDIASLALISSTGTYSLSGSGITITGNNLSTSTVHSCAISGDVTFDREDTSNSSTLSANGTVTLCGASQTFTVDKTVVATGL